METAETTITEIVTETEPVIETFTESVTETFTEILTDSFTETVTTLTTADFSNLAEIDVDLLNRFLYLGTSFIIACLFWFVIKGLYRLFNIFF